MEIILLAVGFVVFVVLFVVTFIRDYIRWRKMDNEKGHNELISLLHENKEDMFDAVARQIDRGATEQFKRFNVITDGVQNALARNREESTKHLDARLNDIHVQMDKRLRLMQESNEKRLEQMQGIVDEKLQKTLQTRFDQSFEMVRKQLANVEQGLGEMKNLAADAKSLKNALTNVKERGTYGEVRLEKLLTDILAPGQYEMNAEIEDGKRVEFVVKLPGHGAEPLLLPIDSKFPIEDYNRLLDAEDKKTMDDARRALAIAIRKSAKEIADKYISPPKTTDFALMFLPTEGLYAEVLQNASLFEELRDKYKVTAVGATTLSAFLSSLQMGFRTLAIEKRSLEVWDTLRAVKTEFVKFGDILQKARNQIRTVDNTLGDIVGTRTNVINRRLRSVEVLDDTDGVYIEEELQEPHGIEVQDDGGME
ncbi:MAG: DNA recombination protein RmuC [Defluviitaleaceae bacterium]|nr:DNA recombination protein RmuC [Defluviitaleaceae bacterium]